MAAVSLGTYKIAGMQKTIPQPTSDCATHVGTAHQNFRHGGEKFPLLWGG